MNIFGQKIKHKVFGTGMVSWQEGNRVRITFSTGEKPFEYPSAFASFLVAEDGSIQRAILAEIAAEKEAKDKAEREATEKKLAEEAAIKAASRQEMGASKKLKNNTPRAFVRTSHIEGTRMIFYVFQGSTYDIERRGGYIWAPITNKEGMSFHHWKSLLDIRKGDIILHGWNGKVVAVSTAKGECYEAQRPKEVVVEGLWEREGRRVNCEYFPVDTPIKTKDYLDDILRLSVAKYSPFDKTGNGNMGYLYEIDRELARIFIKELVVRNAHLKDVDFISEVLSEEKE